MKITKKIIISLILIIMLFNIIFPLFCVKVAAITTEQRQASEMLARFSVNFVANHGSETLYDWSSNRNRSYLGIKTPAGSRGSHSTYKKAAYGMDCVGWLSFAIHHSLHLGNRSFTTFAAPTGNGMSGIHREYFDIISPQNWSGENRLPGDIIVNHRHVMIYIGNNKVAESLRGSGVTISTLDGRDWHKIGKIGRINARCAKIALNNGATDTFKPGDIKHEVNFGEDGTGIENRTRGVRAI